MARLQGPPGPVQGLAKGGRAFGKAVPRVAGRLATCVEFVNRRSVAKDRRSLAKDGWSLATDLRSLAKDRRSLATACGPWPRPAVLGQGLRSLAKDLRQTWMVIRNEFSEKLRPRPWPRTGGGVILQPAVLGQGPQVLGQGWVVFGHGSAVLGQGPAVLGQGLRSLATACGRWPRTSGRPGG